jgi:PAS domain S-box-containing protein
MADGLATTGERLMALSQLLLFVVSALFLALAVFVFRAGRHNPIHYWFASFVMCAAAWTFGIAGRQWGTHLEAWNDLAFASASLLPATFFGFTYVFPIRPSWLPRWTVTASLVLGGLLAVLSAVTPLVYYDPEMTPDGFARKSGPLYPVFAVYLLLVWMLALGTLFAKWRTARGVARVQLRYVSWAFLLAGLGGMTTNLVLPWFTGLSTYSWFGPYFGVVLIGLIAHTIIRHRLMDLRLVIHRGLAGGIAAFLSFLPVALLVGFVWPRLAEHLDRAEFVVLTAAVFAVGLLSPVARAGAARLLDRYLYRTRTNYERTVRAASTGLTRVLNMDELVTVLATTLRDAIGPEGIAVYASSNVRLLLISSVRSLESGRFGLPEELPPALAETLARAKDAIATDHLPASASATREGQSMHALNWAVVLPLLAEDTLIGAIAIGPKLSGDPFYRDDLNLLMTLANQAGVALRNAQRYAEVVVAHEYVARIVASISSGVVAVNRTAHITLFNDAAAELTGTAHADVHDRDVSVLPRSLAAALKDAVRTGEVVSVPEVTLRQDTSSRPVTLTASPVHDLSGGIVGAVAVFNDLTPVRELEKERRKAERIAYFEMLASGVAHEIKNPLVAIKTFVQLLPRRQSDQPWVENFGRVTTTEIARIEKLLERLRTLGKPSDRPRVRVDLRGPIAEAVDLLKPLLAENATKLVVKLPAEAVVTVADHDGLKQLVLNLLANAQEATPANGTITVELATEPSAAVLTVTDSGDGIPSELLERIFDPFMTTKQQGTGLGLAISAAMAAVHGGTLRAANSPGGGACFTLTLPLAPVAPALMTA